MATAINYNRKPVTFYDGGLANVLQPGANRGNVFYVFGLDGSIGADTNSGLRPDVPFKTLKAALAACTDEMHDTIVVMDYWQPTGETWPIAVNKTTVAIVGGYSRTFMPWACIIPPSDTAALSVQATSHIENLFISGGANHGGIEFVGGPQRCSVFRCFFNAGKYGITAAVHACGMGTDVAFCEFHSALTNGGIYLDNPPWCRFHDNLFHSCGAVGINLIQAGSCEILDNVIAVDADTQGHGITLGAGCTDCVVARNVANFGDTDMAANPYLDGAVATTNNWMLNYKGNALIQPA
jgi:hypothetical protein